MTARCQLLARLVLAAVFAWSGIVHGLRPDAFAEHIRHFHLLNTSLSAALALYLAALELVVALALLSARWQRAALVVVLTLLIIFLGALLLAAIRGIDLACGCFSSAAEGHHPLWALVRDLGLLGVVCFALWRGNAHGGLTPRPSGSG